MAFLRDVSDRVWNFISPRKTQRRRDKPFKVPALPTKATKVTTSSTGSPEMTVKTKLARWQLTTPSSVSSVDPTLLPPSPPTSVSRGTDFEGDTLIHDSIEGRDPVSEEEWDANEQTLVVDDGEYMELQKSVNRENERLKQEVQGRELREAGWTEDAVFLFQKLNLRGFEPLLPDTWVNDFDSLPVDLFTANDNKSFIRSDSGTDFRAQLALTKLFALGGFARDAVLTSAPRRTPERRIASSVRQYYTWAMQDSNMRHIWQNLSLFAIVTCDKSIPTYIAEQKMIEKFIQLREQWNEAFQAHRKEMPLETAPDDLPTLYGVIASHTVMAFVSYVLPTETNPDGSLRTIAIFDFGNEGYDVWNSLAIAIFVIHCRNRMKQLQEFIPEPIVARQHDPDL